MKVVTSKAEDQKLVNGLKAGDNLVIRELYQQFYQSIKGNVKQWGGGEEDAKDIFQEGVMVLYRMVRKPDFKLTAALFSLLYSICRNLWLKEVNKRSRQQALSGAAEMELADTTDIVEAIQERSVNRLFRQKMGGLGEQCKKLLDLFFQGRSMKEIVQELGLSSVSFAKKKKFQCKDRLVRMVQADPLYRELKY